MGNSSTQSQTMYEIQIEGELDVGWQQWFNGLDVTLANRTLSPVTILRGPVADQAALRGILCKLWDLNLTLISVQRIEEGEGKENE